MHNATIRRLVLGLWLISAFAVTSAWTEGKKPAPSLWEMTVPYVAPQTTYIGEDSNDRMGTWVVKGTIKAGETVTLSPVVWQEMANSCLVVTAYGKGGGDHATKGLQLFAKSPGAAWAADFVSPTLEGVPWERYGGLTLAINSHSPENSSHHPGPWPWAISVYSDIKREVTVRFDVEYTKAHATYPPEYEQYFGAVSGPFNKALVEKYGVQQ